MRRQLQRVLRSGDKALEDRLAKAGLKPEWDRLPIGLDRFQDVDFQRDGKTVVARTPPTGDVGRVFQAVGIALPPVVRAANAAAAAS